MRERRADTTKLLRSVWLFSTCSQRQLAQVARLVTEARFEPGEVLIRQGDRGNDCYILVEGKAEVLRNGIEVALLQPGDCAGELALLNHAHRDATVVAQSALTALRLERREFATVIDTVPGMARKLLAHLAVRIHRLESPASAR